MADQKGSRPELPNETLKRIPGAEPHAQIDAMWWLVVGVIVIVILLIVFVPDPYFNMLKFVTDGIVITVTVTLVSFIFVLVAGLIGALGRLSKNRIINTIATLYVELIRGIPLLVQLIWWYFAFPVIVQSIGRSLNLRFLVSYQANPVAMAIVGLVFCYGAYMSEIYRAGIQSIAKGQVEAARSLGMNYFQAMRYVILPQAIMVILPPVGNEFIALLKDSSLVSVVAVTDLTKRSREYMSTHFNPIETWSMAALLYLIMTLLSARVINYIEQKTKFER
jgi:polar amino acid transport system permease protein